MRKRRFGSFAAGVSVVGQGTWRIEQDHDASRGALRAGVDAGMTHIDTAEMYGSGEAEEVVAEAVGNRRDELFLVSKVLPENASRRGVVAACEKSLARLGTDRLDCYLLHWRGGHPLTETVAGFEQLKADGKILSWGVSNFDVPDLEEISKLGRPACNQVLYHLKERAIEHSVIPWCTKHDVAVVAYSPFGSGSFPRSPVLDEIAKAHDATARQVALAFLLREPNLFTIPKTSNVKHATDNAAEVTLTPAELSRIDAAFPRGPKPRHLPMI